MLEDVVGVLGLLQRLQEASTPRSGLIRSIFLQVGPIDIHFVGYFQHEGEDMFIDDFQSPLEDRNQSWTFTQQLLNDLSSQHFARENLGKQLPAAKRE